MSKIMLDLSNYKSAFGDYVDPGKYMVQVTDVEQNTSRKGDPQLQVHYTIMDGDFKGQQLVERYPLDPNSKALFRTVNFLNGIGIPTPKKRFNFDTKTLLGRKVLAKVEDNEWQGNVSSQISAFTRVRSTAKDEPDLEDALGQENASEEEVFSDLGDGTTDDLDADLGDLII